MSRAAADPGVIRILVADDESELREMLRAVLSAEGWLVDQAVSAADALERYSREAYDIVVLDHNMPGGTGLDAARRLVAAGADAGSIVLFSAYLGSELTAPCRELGIHALDKADWAELVLVCRDLAVRTAAPRAPRPWEVRDGTTLVVR